MIRRDLVPTLKEQSDRELNVWVAVAPDGAIAGVAVLEKLDGEGWELSCVGVSVNHRRQGIAKGLITRAVSRTAARQAETLAVLVDYQNRPMIGLLEGLQGIKRDASEVGWPWTAYSLSPEVLVNVLKQERAAEPQALYPSV